MSTATFNPTAGLEKVERESDLIPGDKVAVTYYTSEGDIHTVATFTKDSASMNYLFDGDKDVHFVEKAPRVTFELGTFGVGVTHNGTTVRGYVDNDGDLVAIREDGLSGGYYNPAELKEFHEVKLELPELAQVDLGVAPTFKVSDLRPGQDAEPNRNSILQDTHGDKWEYLEDQRQWVWVREDGSSSSFYRGSWDVDNSELRSVAPFEIVGSRERREAAVKTEGLVPMVDELPEGAKILEDANGRRWGMKSGYENCIYQFEVVPWGQNTYAKERAPFKVVEWYDGHGPQAAPKLEGLIPGEDPLPEGYRVFVDKDGDHWGIADEDEQPYIMTTGYRSWDEPDQFITTCAPFKAVR
jgi:hypothetical protein